MVRFEFPVLLRPDTSKLSMNISGLTILRSISFGSLTAILLPLKSKVNFDGLLPLSLLFFDFGSVSSSSELEYKPADVSVRFLAFPLAASAICPNTFESCLDCFLKLRNYSSFSFD